MGQAREEILNNVRQALNTVPDRAVAQLPDPARVRSRIPGTTEIELDQLLSMIAELGGKTRRLQSRLDIEGVLAELVRDESVKKATMWETAELRDLRIGEILQQFGVELVPAHADKRDIAACDAGITGVDAWLAESGTLVLVSSPDQPLMTSLLPRIHLAVLHPSAMRADLRELFDELGEKKHFVLISGPSRTTDIEKVLALGVHGPKELYVWCLE